MRKLFIISTIIFWLAVAGFRFAGFQDQAAQTVAVPPVAIPAIRAYTPAEVARHKQVNDCWMAIAGNVYDITAYLPAHPSDPGIISVWCGREATTAWQTKTRGRPHSAYADTLLLQYRIGVLQAAP